MTSYVIDFAEWGLHVPPSGPTIWVLARTRYVFYQKKVRGCTRFDSKSEQIKISLVTDLPQPHGKEATSAAFLPDLLAFLRRFNNNRTPPR